MPFLAARSLLVGAAVVLVLVGAVVSLAPSSRAAVLGAGACCAVLDVALVRSVRAVVPGDAVVQVGPRSTSAVAPVLAGDEDRPALDDGDDPADRADRTDRTNSADRGVATILLGHTDDGGPVTTGTGGHVVVVGSGALARGVFRSVVEQVRAAGPPGVERVAGDPGLRDDLPAAGGACPTLPADTAVFVRLGPDGRPDASVVLVPGLGQLPRLRDATIIVTRYGCTLGDRDTTPPRPWAEPSSGPARTARGTPFTPILPLLPVLPVPPVRPAA